jgi:hypothetical protein
MSSARFVVLAAACLLAGCASPENSDGSASDDDFARARARFAGRSVRERLEALPLPHGRALEDLDPGPGMTAYFVRDTLAALIPGAAFACTYNGYQSIAEVFAGRELAAFVARETGTAISCDANGLSLLFPLQALPRVRAFLQLVNAQLGREAETRLASLDVPLVDQVRNEHIEDTAEAAISIAPILRFLGTGYIAYAREVSFTNGTLDFGPDTASEQIGGAVCRFLRDKGGIPYPIFALRWSIDFERGLLNVHDSPERVQRARETVARVNDAIGGR